MPLFARWCAAFLLSEIFIPPQNWEKIFFLMAQPMGIPRPTARFVKELPNLTKAGEAISLKSQNERLSWPLFLC